jgi:hypothetical protein
MEQETGYPQIDNGPGKKGMLDRTRDLFRTGITGKDPSLDRFILLNMAGGLPGEPVAGVDGHEIERLIRSPGPSGKYLEYSWLTAAGTGPGRRQKISAVPAAASRPVSGELQDSWNTGQAASELQQWYQSSFPESADRGFWL